MNATTWQRIYSKLDDKQWAMSLARGRDLSGASPGIAINQDDLARQWQRLDRIKHRVGLHFCRARDREHGMKIPSWPLGRSQRTKTCPGFMTTLPGR